MEIKNLENKLSGFVAAFKEELTGIRTNRPTAKLVENIKVEVYGRQMTVKQLGSISIVPPREIDINLWDKEAVSAVAKAVETSGSGLTANIDGNLIRINLPTLTDERRKELVKVVGKMAEETKMKIRSARDETNKEIEKEFKEKKIGEDQKFKLREQTQKAVDRSNEELEKLLEGKMKEIQE